MVDLVSEQRSFWWRISEAQAIEQYDGFDRSIVSMHTVKASWVDEMAFWGKNNSFWFGCVGLKLPKWMCIGACKNMLKWRRNTSVWFHWTKVNRIRSGEKSIAKSNRWIKLRVKSVTLSQTFSFWNASWFLLNYLWFKGSFEFEHLCLNWCVGKRFHVTNDAVHFERRAT